MTSTAIESPIMGSTVDPGGMKWVHYRRLQLDIHEALDAYRDAVQDRATIAWHGQWLTPDGPGWEDHQRVVEAANATEQQARDRLLGLLGFA